MPVMPDFSKIPEPEHIPLVDNLEDIKAILSDAAKKEAEQLAEERAKEKRNKVFDVFLVLLGSALTLLFEHFSAIAEFIAGLFGK